MTEKEDDHDHGNGVASPKTSLQRPLWGINNGTAATGRELSSWRETAPAFEGDLPLIAEMGPKGEVAARVDISGMLNKPHTSRWQIIGQLIRNAFIKTILPGFDKELSGSQKR